jgi:acyl carrier protein
LGFDNSFAIVMRGDDARRRLRFVEAAETALYRVAEEGGGVLEIFAQVTRYPMEVLDPSASLEEDLGIDSVKLGEVFAVLREKYNLPEKLDLPREQLQTIGGITEALQAYLRAPADAARAEGVAEPARPQPANGNGNGFGDPAAMKAGVLAIFALVSVPGWYERDRPGFAVEGNVAGDLRFQPLGRADRGALRLGFPEQRIGQIGFRLIPGNNIGYFGPHEYMWRTITSEPANAVPASTERAMS